MRHVAPFTHTRKSMPNNELMSPEAFQEQDINSIERFLRESVESYRKAVRRTVDEAWAIGRWLNAGKEKMPHGTFTDWMKDQVGEIMSEKTAQRSMAMARKYTIDDVKGKGISEILIEMRDPEYGQDVSRETSSQFKFERSEDAKDTPEEREITRTEPVEEATYTDIDEDAPPPKQLPEPKPHQDTSEAIEQKNKTIKNLEERLAETNRENTRYKAQIETWRNKAHDIETTLNAVLARLQKHEDVSREDFGDSL